MIRTILRAALAAVTVTLAACGGGSNTCVDVTGGNACSGGGGGGGTPVASDLVLVLSSASLPNDGSQTVSATVTALDGNRNALAGVPVTISVNQNAIATASAAVTDTSGVLSAAIGIGADSTNRTITVTATSGSLTRTASLEVRDPVLGGGTGPTITLSLSNTVVTPLTPATVTLTVRSPNGLPISGVVVGLATSRGNLAVLGRTSVLTDSTGTATTTLNAVTSGASGSDDLLATAALGSTVISGSTAFTVEGASPTVQAAIGTTTLRPSTGPVVLSATLRNAAGAAVSGQPVTFSATNGRVQFGAPSVLTNSSGVATTTVQVAPNVPTSADVIEIGSSVAGQAVGTTVPVQVIAESHSVSVVLSTSSITQTQPATATITVVDASGVPVRDAVVNFSSQYNLVSFQSATSATNGAGIATMVVTPRTGSASGADVITASVNLLGVVQAAQAVVQVTSSVPVGTPTLDLALDQASITAAQPANVTATLRNASGEPVAGQVVTFTVSRGIGSTNVPTRLTNSAGQAVVILSPTSSSAAGADEVTASVTYAGTTLQQTRGFDVQATNATIDAFAAPVTRLSAYGQTPLTIQVSGASVTTPVNVSITSACVALGKATLSPASFSATSAVTTVQYRDEGCGALQPQDQLLAVIDATAASRTLSLPIDAPLESSLAFVGATPEVIYLKGSGFTESSVVVFQVRDAAGNPLPGKTVEMRLLTGAGGVTMEGRGVESVNPPSASPFTQESNALGQVSARVNSGSVPTPVRIHAKIRGTEIATVSSNLSVAVGLPSQLNFSLSQGARNIEGYNIDGTPNTYQIIAADRSGNPIPAGTSINFVTEGGQIEGIRQTQLVNGIARTVANFVSADPRPVDGRVTITAYALGEESFLDLDGNNLFTNGEPFQDLGNIFKDRNFDGLFDSTEDEFLPLAVNNSAACVAPGNNLLLLNPSIPSMSIDNGNSVDTCDSRWSGAGQVYVRRATETVLSTSSARPLWFSTAGLDDSCAKIDLQVGPNPASDRGRFTLMQGGDTWYAGSGGNSLTFIVGDANPGAANLGLLPRLNPMAAGTAITATATPGLAVLVGGSPVPSTSEASTATVVVTFDNASSGTVFINITSPSGLRSTFPIPVTVATRPTVCN